MTWTTTSVVEAQPSERFPSHTTLIVDGVRYEGFDLGGFTQLLRIDADLTTNIRLVENLQGQLASCGRASFSLQTALEASMEQVETLRAENTRLSSRWEEENRGRLEAENRPNLEAIFGWTLTAVFAVSTLVLSIIVGAAI